jgi:hypothetical protein
MSIFAINPGSGPVAEASLEHAEKNIRIFAEEIIQHYGLTVKEIFRIEEEDDDGYYAYGFDVEKDGLERRIRVDMPGLPLEQVHFLGLADQDAWGFKRLDIDRSSWLWKYAVNCCNVKPDVDQSPFPTRCPERVEIHDQSYRCERDSVHKGKCQTKVIVAGYAQEDLGPNIWTFVKWTAARKILT